MLKLVGIIFYPWGVMSTIKRSKISMCMRSTSLGMIGIVTVYYFVNIVFVFVCW